MSIGSFSYTRSGLVSLARSQFRRSSDVTRSDRLKGNQFLPQAVFLVAFRNSEVVDSDVFMCGIYKCRQPVNGGLRDQSCFFFLLSTIFIFIFYKQHNIISKIKQNKTADTYSTSQSSIKREGEREGQQEHKSYSFK